MNSRTVLLLLAAVFSGCSAGTAARYEMRVAGHLVDVEIADTPEERASGLMNRKTLKEDQGMLFVFDREERVSFWMKNTSIPLSIAFISADGTIRQIEDMESFSLESIPSRRSVLYALEVNRGWFDERGIAVGDRVEIPDYNDGSRR
jgi:uncharacterized membrane protein (UPF0127 family)